MWAPVSDLTTSQYARALHLKEQLLWMRVGHDYWLNSAKYNTKLSWRDWIRPQLVSITVRKALTTLSEDTAHKFNLNPPCRHCYKTCNTSQHRVPISGPLLVPCYYYNSSSLTSLAKVTKSHCKVCRRHEYVSNEAAMLIDMQIDSTYPLIWGLNWYTFPDGATSSSALSSGHTMSSPRARIPCIRAKALVRLVNPNQIWVSY